MTAPCLYYVMTLCLYRCDCTVLVYVVFMFCDDAMCCAVVTQCGSEELIVSQLVVIEFVTTVNVLVLCDFTVLVYVHVDVFCIHDL